MTDWEREFDDMIVAAFNADDVPPTRGRLYEIRGKDLVTVKAFIQRQLDEQAERFCRIVMDAEKTLR